MTNPITLAALVLGGMVLLLQVMIIFERVVSDRRRKRGAELRPGLEMEFATYVGDADAETPVAPDSKIGRQVLREVAVESIVELRGRERDRLLKLLEDMGTIDELCMELLSESPVDRRQAAEVLGEMNSQEAANDLHFGCTDPDILSRLASAHALAELGREEYAPAVLDAVDAGAAKSPGAAAAILLAVGAHYPETLSNALSSHRSPACRRLGIEVVAELRLSDHAPLLRRTLDEDDDELVAKAARGLGAIGDPDAVDSLVRVAEAPQRAWFCRVAAGVALGNIGDPRAAPALEALLEDGDRWVTRDRAAAALAKLGGDGQDALRRARASLDEEVRELATVALAA